MQAILKIISLILWAIDYAKNNPKKATAATLGSGVVAMGLYSGVPTYPPFPVSGTKDDGDVPTVQADDVSVAWEPGGGGGGASDLPDLGDVADTLTGNTGDIFGFDGTDWDDMTLEEIFTAGIGNGTADYVLTTDGAGAIGWAAASGGSGITYETAPTYGEIPVFDDASNDYVATRAGAPVYSVKDPILYDPPGGEAARMVRAAGSDAQTTATTTASSTTVTLADASSYQRGNGIAISGAGASHGLAAPSNCFAIPVSVYQTAPETDMYVAPVPFTVDATNNTILLTPTSSNASNQILMPWAPGTRVRLSQQGSTFPTLASGAFSEGTDYYVAPLPETTTVAMAGTATAGTYRLYLSYKGENPFFHTEQDPSLYCTVAYNADATAFQTAIRTLPGCAQVTAVISAGSVPNATYTITWTGVPGRVHLQYDLGDGVSTSTYGLTGGTPGCTITSTRSGGYTVHDTEAHAIAGTDIFDPTGAGSGFVSEYGSRTHAFQVATLSGKGGVSAASTSFSTTTGPLDVNEFSRIPICWDLVAGSHGYVVYDATTGDEKVITAVSQLSNIFRVNLNAGGYTNYEFGDIGKTFSDGSVTGTIECFDNATRNVWVRRSVITGFPTNGATITTSGGTGGGTQNGASTRAFIYWYTGKSHKRIYGHYAPINYKGKERIYPGQVMELYGNLYTCQDVSGTERATEDVTFTVDTSTNVVTFSTGLNVAAAGTRLYLHSSMALPNTATGRLSSHGAYFGRFSGATATLHPTAADAIANTNVIDITDSGFGTHYCRNPNSFATTLGSYTNDGGVSWRRQNMGYPSTPPASAINDLHLAIVMSKSGSDVVLSAAPATSVVSQLATHDDTESFVANHAASQAVGAKSRTVYVPTGKYVLTLIQPDSDTRNSTAYAAVGFSYTLFKWGAGTDWRSGLWQGDADAQITFATTWDQSALDEASGFYIDDGYLTINMTWRGGMEVQDLTFVHAPLTVPVTESHFAENGVPFYGVNPDTTVGGSYINKDRMDGPKFKNVNFYAWGLVGGGEWNSNSTRSELFEDCDIHWGGANHNACIYPSGGNFLRTHIRGIRAENSMTLYQAYANGQALNIDSCHFERAMKDGCVAVRSSEFRAVNSKFSNCVKLFVREIADSFVVDNCDFYSTSVVPHNSGVTIARDVRLSNLRMVNSGIGVINTNVNIRDVQILYTARPIQFKGTTTSIADLGGVNQTVDGLTIDNRQWQNDTRCLIFGGNGTFANVKVLRSMGTWGTFATTGAGYKVLDRCEFWTKHGSTTACLVAHTGEMKVINCVFGGHSYTWDGGGRTDFEGCTLGSGAFFTFGTGITGPTYVRRNQWNGSPFFAEPSLIIEDNNFAAAPSITGATQATRGNRVADSLSVTAAALASGVNNDVALPVTDQVRLDPNAANSTVTSFVACADGVEKTIICTDAGAATITIDSSAATGTAANKIMCPGDTDIVMSTGERIVIRYDATTSLWYVIGGQYVAMDWQGGAIQLWQQGEQFWNQPATREWALAA